MTTFYRGYISPKQTALSSIGEAPGVWSLPDLTKYIQDYGGPAYIGTYRFTSPRQFDDPSSLWTVPQGVVYLYVRCWGSGAPGGNYPNSIADGDGGAGGYAEAVIPVTELEQLYVGVGTKLNNGGVNKSFGGPGGGLSGVFRGSQNLTWGGGTWPSPLIIAGGGGGGSTNNSSAGGAGGGAVGQTSTSGLAGGNQTGTTGSGTSINGGNGGGGGGYYGGAGSSYFYAGGGGSGFVNATGNLHTTTTTGDLRTPPNTDSQDYPTGASPGGMAFAVGGIGADNSDQTHGSGAVIIHALGSGYDPSGLPVIPFPRNVLGTY